MQRGPLLQLAALLSILALPASGDAVASPADENASEQEASERPKTLSAIVQADDQLSVATQRSRRVQQWLRQARAEKNEPRVRCLDRKLSQAHAIERGARRERDAIARSARRSPSTPRQREWLALHQRRLELFVERSGAVADDAYWCGRQAHRQVKLPTTYRVRVIRPPLPSADRVTPSSNAAAWR